MIIIQQRGSSICRTVLLTVLLQFTSTGKSNSNQRICENRNIRSISYFEVSNEAVNWSEAWRLCNNYNRSTLPVICNQHEQHALANYLKAKNSGRSSAAWTSGRKTKFDEWTWVDGQRFNPRLRVVMPGQKGNYNHAALKEDRNYKTENPLNKVYYLCQYSVLGSSCNHGKAVHARNICVSIHDGTSDDRSWYDARNQCLTNGGDLAILDDDDIDILIGSNKLNAAYSYWIGLRRIAWHWQTTVPFGDSGEEVIYGNWLNDPYSSSGECISIDVRNGRWKADECMNRKKVVCQASSDETTSSTSSVTTSNSPTFSSKSSSTTSNAILSTTTRAMSSTSEGETQSPTNVKSHVLLYSGVGAGIVIIIICIIVIILAVRCRGKSHKDENQSKVKDKSERNRLDLSPNKPTTSPANAPANAPVAGADDTLGVYAEISLATLNQREDGTNTQQPGIVYASLDFQKEPTSLERDKKSARTTDPTKQGTANRSYQDFETTGRQANPDGAYTGLQLQPVYEEVSQREN